jgi:hypothetical protein
MSVSPLKFSVLKVVASWQNYEIGNTHPALFFNHNREDRLTELKAYLSRDIFILPTLEYFIHHMAD